MTDNHLPGQNPTPAHVAGALLVAAYLATVLTPGQLEQLTHLDTLIGLTGLILTATPRTGRG
ncbi:MULTISPECIES: hypothetical protein [unclassified Streptomyces]|uniref:hypothetical protein n=1 Tax=unclassified Streptomyces TaxID=2593676 RepID=UPI0004C859CE|nr:MULTISPECIES: hypothetical protein [unclassified Streptomyces]